MPVTARLSQKFYETFGEDVTNELVDWFNAVDATYRADLRELNELNFARFDAKLEQRLAELDARWGGRWTQLDAKLEQRFAQSDAKWERRFAEFDVKLAEVKGELVAEMGRLRGETTAAIASAQSTTVKWMFGFWAPTAVGIVATGLGVITLLLRR